MRTLLIFSALIVSGIGFARLTQRSPTVLPPAVESHEESEGIPAKVYLTFSRFTESQDLKIGGMNVELTRDGKGDYVGRVSIDPQNPVVFLKVSCLPLPDQPASRFFAKLVVEAEGEETFTHVFDAEGDIDDFVELPF